MKMEKKSLIMTAVIMLCGYLARLWRVKYLSLSVSLFVSLIGVGTRVESCPHVTRRGIPK